MKKTNGASRANQEEKEMGKQNRTKQNKENNNKKITRKLQTIIHEHRFKSLNTFQ